MPARWSVCTIRSNLQVRADVRLEDVPQVQIGQPVQITTAAQASRSTGQVLGDDLAGRHSEEHAAGQGAIDDPPAVIKPEMLVQVTFLAPEQPGEQVGR